LRVHPDVAKALKLTNSRWIEEMEELTKRTVLVKSDPLLHPEQFDLQ
jgi:ribonuclease G